MALADWERTTDTSTTQFFQFMKVLAENNLLDKAPKILSDKGLTQIRVSVQHIREVQNLLRDHFQDKGTASVNAVILSAHVDGVCK